MGNLREVAVDEAGHAVVARLFGRKIVEAGAWLANGDPEVFCGMTVNTGTREQDRWRGILSACALGKIPAENESVVPDAYVCEEACIAMSGSLARIFDGQDPEPATVEHDKRYVEALVDLLAERNKLVRSDVLDFLRAATYAIVEENMAAVLSVAEAIMLVALSAKSGRGGAVLAPRATRLVDNAHPLRAALALWLPDGIPWWLRKTGKGGA